MPLQVQRLFKGCCPVGGARANFTAGETVRMIKKNFNNTFFQYTTSSGRRAWAPVAALVGYDEDTGEYTRFNKDEGGTEDADSTSTPEATTSGTPDPGAAKGGGGGGGGGGSDGGATAAIVIILLLLLVGGVVGGLYMAKQHDKFPFDDSDLGDKIITAPAKFVGWYVL